MLVKKYTVACSVIGSDWAISTHYGNSHGRELRIRNQFGFNKFDRNLNIKAPAIFCSYSAYRAKKKCSSIDSILVIYEE